MDKECIKKGISPLDVSQKEDKSVILLTLNISMVYQYFFLNIKNTKVNRFFITLSMNNINYVQIKPQTATVISPSPLSDYNETRMIFFIS